MGFAILIVVGGVLGWLASILTRTEDKQGILLFLGVGAGVAVLAGFAINRGSILIGISGSALLAAFLATIAALAALWFVRRKTAS